MSVNGDNINVNENVAQGQIETLNTRVSLRIPPFWKVNPHLWFCQVEAQFAMNSIVAEKRKYHAVVASIESEILSQVSDVILNPPETEEYTTLKRCLLERFADSEEQRLKRLITDLDLGDKRPSHLLREMKELAGPHVNEGMVKSLWLQRLPQQAQAILSCSSEGLDKLSTLADKISEVTRPTEVYGISNSGEVNPLQVQILELTKKVSELCNNRGRSTNKSRSKSRSFSKSNEKNICWYHRKFNEKASKCISPCAFNKSSKN